MEVFPKTSEKATPSVSRMYLFSDGCGGQNKNNIVVGMVQKWLFQQKLGVSEVSLIFPVRGHSFLPCDRLFGRISRDIRSRSNIVTPGEYHDIFRMHAKVFVYGKDWTVLDFKSAVAETYKRIIGLQDFKRIVLSRNSKGRVVKIDVRGEVAYNTDVNKEQNLLKARASHAKIKLRPLKGVRPVSSAKHRDIRNLLKVTYGEEWESVAELAFYKTLTNDQTLVESDVDPACPHDECNCGDEDVEHV